MRLRVSVWVCFGVRQSDCHVEMDESMSGGGQGSTDARKHGSMGEEEKEIPTERRL